MANNNPESETNGGQAEAAVSGNNANTSARRSQDESRKAETSSAPTAPMLTTQPSNNLVPISSPSPVSSPRNSGTTSPVRQSSRPQPLSNPLSTQPSAAAIQRALSAANTPQLQSTAVADGASKLPRAPKSAGAVGDSAPHWPTSQRLKSPPPSESNSRRGSSTAQKKIETGHAPSISVQNATPQTTTPPPVKQGGEQTSKGTQLPTPAKGPSRGASGKSVLETVRENSTDDVKEPSAAAVQAAADLKPLTKLSDDEKQSSKRENLGTEGENTAQQAESGSESTGTKSPKKKEQNDQAQRPKTQQSKSYASLASTKSRQQEGKPNMTVETETVPSIPQSALNVGDRSGAGRGENSGSVKQKPSSEAIRPKKERKKTAQKARSINQGTGMFYIPKSPLLTSQAYVEDTADNSGSGSSRSSSTAREVTSSGADSPLPKRQYSYLQRSLSFRTPTLFIRSLSNRYMRKASSKADIFEQRVANAVDEANSSDSDETFVYESNPIEPQRRARQHSRTPSVTSSHSVADQQRTGVRNLGDVLDERKVAGKRSMKFSSNAYNDIDTPDGKDGSVRSHTPRHFGRFGRGGSQQSMFDPDSPFTQASKLRSNQSNARNSRPNSPRGPHNLHKQQQQQQRSSGLFGRKQEPSYDFDAEVGDDERTPLVGTVRTPRGARLARRINRSPSIDEYYGVRRRSRCGRFGGCLLGLIVLVIVLCSTVAFLVMSNRPLYQVKILQIENVLASEQELMLDLWVSAVNPNALGITITDMDINIFAKSKHVGSGGSVPLTTPRWRSRRKWRKRSASPQVTETDESDVWQDLSEHWHAPTGGVDEGTDPPDDDLDKDAQTMLLGRIFHFDQALTFEGSPLKRHSHNSTGELRLEKPGNKTETGGSERWERVLQNPFELIIRGLLKYQLPISSRMQTVAVGSSTIVHPENVGKSGNMRLEKVDLSEHWQWIAWDGFKNMPTAEESDGARVVELD